MSNITQRLLREANKFDRVLFPERFRVPKPFVRPRAALRAARFARLGRAAATVGGVALAPEAALAAGAAAVGYGGYKLGKYLQERKAIPKSRKQKRSLPSDLPHSPPIKFPVKDTPISHRPVLVPKPPLVDPMAPNRPKTGQNTAGRKKMWIPKVSPVSTITKAPVAIGNTIRGSQTVERMTRTGHACTGRDFMFTPVAPGNVANWTMVGGCPLSPTAFADSSLRQYAQIYNKFRFLQFTAHFITSSPTSTNGDVMFYYGKNRESPFLNQTSVNLLPFVMSDPNAVLGPQWQNMSATFEVDSEWKSLDYGIDDSPKEYAAGELFLLCKTSNTESPGYVIFDYVIEFGEKSIQPRLLSLPITREIYSQLGMTTTGALVINTPYILVQSGNNISGTTSVLPPNTTDGDIYKVIIDVTNSILGANSGNVTSSLYGHEVAGSTGTITMSDGFICYAVFRAGSGFVLYLNSAAAYTGATNRQFWASGTSAQPTMTLQVWMSYVGSTNFAISNVSNI